MSRRVSSSPSSGKLQTGGTTSSTAMYPLKTPGKEMAEGSRNSEEDVEFVSEGHIRPVLECVDLLSSDDEEYGHEKLNFHHAHGLQELEFISDLSGKHAAKVCVHEWLKMPGAHVPPPPPPPQRSYLRSPQR
ncbi:unnamed protein product [Ranitomeya imitator]|uniref:Uncharacterized protein n=1 Tax=Ranitomeya imitator TaxID=111125 RepID=A0ABN9KV08_9NEOB|nr:unnamed protein product [Ranitomeya imitator]